MVLVLVVGDLHIPQRAAAIPEEFTQMFSPGRINIVLITGNVGCREMYDYFRTVAPEVYCAKGEFDQWSHTQLKEIHVITVEDLKMASSMDTRWCLVVTGIHWLFCSASWMWMFSFQVPRITAKLLSLTVISLLTPALLQGHLLPHI
ncbi:vacuolar sorting protein [Trypanosoma cruzi]|nr:vacuolar sorting protein [Trypanosoma cruzi]